MTLIYIVELYFITQKTDIGVHKINSLALMTHKIVLADFLLQYKPRKFLFFKKTFLLGDIHIEVVLQMFFLTFPEVNI